MVVESGDTYLTLYCCGRMNSDYYLGHIKIFCDDDKLMMVMMMTGRVHTDAEKS